MQELLTKGFPVSWEELHRTAKALAWRLLEEPKFDGVIALLGADWCRLHCSP